MIIATPPTAPTATVAPDPSAAAHRIGVDDARIAPDAASRTGFGTLLAQRLDARGANDLPAPRPDDEAKSITLGADGRPILVATSGAIAASDDPAAATDRARATGRVADDATRDDDEQKVDGSQAGDDLAAQLAIVSQWAAAARPAEAAAKPSAEADAKGAGPDLPRRVDTARAAVAPAVDAPADGATAAVLPSITTAITTASASPAVVAGTRPVDRAVRSGTVAGLAAATGPEAAPADPKLATTEGPAGRTGEALVAALAGAFDGTTTPATTAPDGAFVTQLGAAQVGTDRAAPAAPGATVTTTLHETVGTPAWSHEVGQATLRMAAADLQTASLQLNPAHLGPLDVQLRIDNGVAHLAFGAAHAETRQALESSRTTLDQLLADQGLKLGDCSVSDGSTSSRGFAADGADSGTPRRDGGGRGSRDDAVDPSTASPTLTTQVRKVLGLVDTFA